MSQKRRGSPLRIGLFNVKYSANLGDGLLVECLERELERAIPGVTTLSLDLAGRVDYAQGRRFRGAALALLERSPVFARQSVAEALLGRALRWRMRPHWKQVLADLDAIVVGGGNLFGDSDLNFPLKIDAAMAEVREAGLPVAVHGVGVSDNWSPRGEELFRRAFAGITLVHASVREERSRGIWNRRLSPAGIRAADLGHDPGLMIADHFARQRLPASGPPLVGLGITHPVLLRYHADDGCVSEADLTAWFAAVARACVGRGWRVALFTNGSSEDDDFLRRIAPAMMAAHPPGALACLPRFQRPADLAGFIGGLDLLMAHRLHASIAAYSFAIPHIGFSWDRKLRSFFERVGRARYLCTTGVDAPEAVASLAAEALAEGIDPVRHETMLADARVGVADLASRLAMAVEARRASVPAARRASSGR